KDLLAERQARAAIALVRMGKDEGVWAHLKHSRDPRLRSFIVNWLNPLGAELNLVAAEFDRLDSLLRRGSPDPPQPADRRSPASEVSSDSGRPSVPLVARSGDLATTHHRAPPTTQEMDAVLFDAKTSKRRALILALGTYEAEELSPGDRDGLTKTLL